MIIQQLQGVWIPVRYEDTDGLHELPSTLSEDNVPNDRLEIEGNTMTSFIYNTKQSCIPFRLSKDNWIDLTYLDKGSPIFVQKGLYRLEGNTLVIAMARIGEPRPAKCEPSANLCVYFYNKYDPTTR